MFAVVAVFVGAEVLAYFPIWLIGAAAAHLPGVGALSAPSRAASFASAVVMCVLVALTRVRPWAAQDYFVGVACGLWVLATAQRERAGVTKDSVAWRAVTELAGFSYSLYVVHLPICLWIRAVFATKSGGVERLQPEPEALACYALSLGAALTGAWAFARATEAQTPKLRAWFYRTLRAR